MNSSTWMMYKSIGKEEREWIRFHPVAARDFQRAATKALAEAQLRYPPTTLHNREGDAFRHCYWSALMARDQDPKLAEEFGNLHEFGPDPDIEHHMDLVNNQVGRSIAKKSGYVSDLALADRCVTALERDELVIIDSGRLVRSKSRSPYWR